MGKTNMTDSLALNQLIDESGLKRKYIAEKLNLSAYGLAKKINGDSEFKQSEIEILCDLLGIRSLGHRQQIFFSNKVDG